VIFSDLNPIDTNTVYCVMFDRQLTYPGVPATLPNEIGALTGLQTLQVVGGNTVPGMLTATLSYLLRLTSTWYSWIPSDILHQSHCNNVPPPRVNRNHCPSRCTVLIPWVGERFQFGFSAQLADGHVPPEQCNQTHEIAELVSLAPLSYLVLFMTDSLY